MALWRVEVAGVSHRFIEAPSEADAIETVRVALTEALELRASPANETLSTLYAEASPIQRRNLLAAMDGLTSPWSRRDVGQARSQLSRYLNWVERTRKWTNARAAEAPTPPPIDPTRVDAMLRASEVRQIERNLARLREADRSSPHHSL